MILQATNLSKHINITHMPPQIILKQINLSIDQGEFVAIMGASGSGKSTLLYTLSGMSQPTAGTVTFAGKILDQLNDTQLTKLRCHKMGLVFQQPNLLSHFNLRDNVILAAYLEKTDTRKSIDARADRLMKQTGVYDLGSKDIGQASGGQLQRVAICRALINQPDILFADEPTGALNATAAGEVMTLFNDVNRSGTTIVLVTHDSRVASQAERILYMSDGMIISEKKLDKLTDPKTLKTRENAVNQWLNQLGF